MKGIKSSPRECLRKVEMTKFIGRKAVLTPLLSFFQLISPYAPDYNTISLSHIAHEVLPKDVPVHPCSEYQDIPNLA